MKKSNLNENNFEKKHVVRVLVEENGYVERTPDDYDKKLCLDAEQLVTFVKETQPREWEKFTEQYQEPEAQIAKRVSDEIEKRGTLSVLREGLADRGARFELAYFKPVSGLNPEHRELYEANRFSVIRQLEYSEKYNKSLDLALFVNGLPIITAELKNHFTGQTYTNAINQYRKSRDPKESLFGRCFAHFAVDNDKAYFATKLEGSKTVFLPFNKGIENPDDSRGFKVSYLYYDYWSKDSLLEIIKHYLTEVEEKDKKGKVIKRKLIFPRIHQITAVRNLLDEVHEDGAGKNYLIQHSAGSGKTFTISWLAHHLRQLHEEGERRLFDTVIVVSDRRVIDKQLRDAVQSFESTKGTVVWADRSDTLRQALENGRQVVVTTLQKFSIVAENMEKLSGSRFAVLVDEAHSSQGGESTRALSKTLTYNSLEEAGEEEGREGAEELSAEEYAIAEMRSRGRVPNVSFFAFTATPKQKTLNLFGRGKENGEYVPHSLYSMRQAIEEGFILDVLQYYTTYQTYFKLVKKIEEDPEYERDKVTGLLHQYVELQPHAINEKTKIMLDHFLNRGRHGIGGRAKTMVVIRSRLHAVRYKLAIERELRDRGMGHIKTLVAFTGTVKDNGFEFTESSMNRVSESQTREKFDEDDYRILVVAHKYQTGFDQPLLQTMYVDKKLQSVNAVQTLSRLNRTYPGKDYVTVFDFVNDADDIQESFQPFYETTILSEGTDPNVLYEYERKIEEWKMTPQDEISAFYEIWQKSSDQSDLHKALEPAVERFRELEREKAKEFKRLLRNYKNIYGFVAQIAEFADPRLEKLYQYTRLLVKKLPLDPDSLPKEVLESVDVNTYGLKETYSGGIQLISKDESIKPILPGEGKKEPSPKERLSAIIQRINEVSGGEVFSEDEASKLDELSRSIQDDEDFERSRQAENTQESLRILFNELFEEQFADMYERDVNFFKKVEGNEKAREIIKEELFNAVVGR